MITVERILQLCPHANRDYVEIMAPAWDAALASFGLTTHLEICHCIGQFAYESGEFTSFEENLNYRADRIAQVWPRLKDRAAELEHNPQALANAAYAGKYGNGDEASGDGYRYRGRGPVQCTFKENYEVLGHAANKDLVANPDEVSDPATGIIIALAFWKYRNCNPPADRDDCEGVTRRINPALEGLAGRLNLTNMAKKIFV